MAARQDPAPIKSRSPGLTRSRHRLFAVITVAIGVSLAILLTEGFFRLLEYGENRRVVREGKGGEWIPDRRWGWKPAPGPYRIATSEFDVAGAVNTLNMNDEPYDPEADSARTRILAVGDSHTYATGVTPAQAWPKVVESELNEITGTHSFRVYNAGVPGYSVHQYLLRLIDQGPALQPDYVVVGLSYATDLYDLLPPDRGGWAHGRWLERDYFDLDSTGQIHLAHWAPASTVNGKFPARSTASGRVRDALNELATFRYLRRSKLALFVGSHVRVGGQTLWPNMEVVLEKSPSSEHEYQWRLLRALLRQIDIETERQGARLIVLGIPYIAQVYDDVWDVTFGRDRRYSRTAAAHRVSEICREYGIVYIDTMDSLRATAARRGQWLHYRKDAHPTAEGHKVIAKTIVESGALKSVRGLARTPAPSRTRD